MACYLFSCMEMNYTEAIAYLYSRLPVFHRIGPKALKPGLGNILRLSEALGNPHLQFRSIHVGGTNGKGSTSHMLASIYQEAGYRVGLYTSPHLKSFTERIRINGCPIAEADVALFVAENKALIEAVEPSFFEVTVAMAFAYFAQQRVDIAVIEVGLGGRLDSTNIITPVASVITNIGYDHMDVLGETLAAIAYEKAGIIKTGVPVIISEKAAATSSVFEQMGRSVTAPLYWAQDLYEIQDNGIQNGLRSVTVSDVKTDSRNEWLLDLIGDYQLKNLPGVLKTIDVLQPIFSVGEEAVAKGIRSVVVNTGLKGRFQVIGRAPLIIVDTAHNQPGLAALFEAVRSIQTGKLHVVFGMVADKNHSRVLSILPKEAQYYFCEANTPRSLSAYDLQKESADYKLVGGVYTNVNSALLAAKEFADVNDTIVITGSNYIVAELNNL